MIGVEVFLSSGQTISFVLPWTDMGFSDTLAMAKVNDLVTALYGHKVLSINYRWPCNP